ncbi:MAG: acyl-protein synthetase [Candidatus Kapabacteria bacterium]|nr:acyl-protein synthetase [Candidatus Kapabacteria bacterium]
MNVIEKLFEYPQYSIPFEEKTNFLLKELNNLTAYHYEKCVPYQNIIKTIYHNNYGNSKNLSEIPFFPVRLFKNIELKSIPDSDVLKTLTSSGTTSMQVSKIFIDRETSLLQTKALASIVTSFIGNKRLPMIIIDSETSLGTASGMSARGAGLVGLSNFGRNHFYALDGNMQLKIKELLEFSEKHSGEKILIFGFTFMVWQNFLEELKKNNIKLNLDGYLIHSGGWKKLTEIAVSNEIFKEKIQEQTGISKIHNFYGMVEQVGSIYMECEQGYFHSPNFSEIILRSFDLKPSNIIGKEGIIQTLSVLPKSYPGHSILTEDLGIIHGIDDCKCGRKGVYFTISGRIPKAELRGCSDVYALAG